MSEEQANNQDIEETKGVSIPIRWKSSEQAPTIYANQLFMSHAGNEFYLVFGELAPITRTSEEEDLPAYLEIKPVIKIAISPPNMLQFAAVINENVDKFMSKRIFQIETDDEGTE